MVSLIVPCHNRALMIQSYKALCEITNPDIDLQILYYSLINLVKKVILKAMRKLNNYEKQSIKN